MLETYFSAPKTLRRLRSGPSGPYIDGFADALENQGYSKASAIRYLRNAAHLGQFLQRNGDDLAALDACSLQASVATCRAATAHHRTVEELTIMLVLECTISTAIWC